ncbi:hypothetical protein [Lacrimispora sp.]|jgi:hypothetical protein|nr:hypothetical protein [Lacrimispora sp.]
MSVSLGNIEECVMIPKEEITGALNIESSGWSVIFLLEDVRYLFNKEFG